MCAIMEAPPARSLWANKRNMCTQATSSSGLQVFVQNQGPTKIPHKNPEFSFFTFDHGWFFFVDLEKVWSVSFQLSWQAPWVHGYPPPTALLLCHRPKINITGRPKAHSARQSEGPFWSQIRHKYISCRRHGGFLKIDDPQERYPLKDVSQRVSGRNLGICFWGGWGSLGYIFPGYVGNSMDFFEKKMKGYYCWWKKSCTSW